MAKCVSIKYFLLFSVAVRWAFFLVSGSFFLPFKLKQSINGFTVFLNVYSLLHTAYIEERIEPCCSRTFCFADLLQICDYSSEQNFLARMKMVSFQGVFPVEDGTLPLNGKRKRI